MGGAVGDTIGGAGEDILLGPIGAAVFRDSGIDKKPVKPPAIPAPPPAANPVTQANSSVQAAGNRAKNAAGAAASSTNPTGSQGLVQPPSIETSKLLG